MSHESHETSTPSTPMPSTSPPAPAAQRGLILTLACTPPCKKGVHPPTQPHLKHRPPCTHSSLPPGLGLHHEACTHPPSRTCSTRRPAHTAPCPPASPCTPPCMRHASTSSKACMPAPVSPVWRTSSTRSARQLGGEWGGWRGVGGGDRVWRTSSTCCAQQLEIGRAHV